MRRTMRCCYSVHTRKQTYSSDTILLITNYENTHKQYVWIVFEQNKTTTKKKERKKINIWCWANGDFPIPRVAFVIYL